MELDTLGATCDFCGEKGEVANPESGPAAICEWCAKKAVELFSESRAGR
jgi:hypothetical protein